MDSFLKNIDFTALDAKYKTPLYIYNLDYIKNQYSLIKDALFGHKSLVCFALKANSNLSIIKYLANLGSGADCVSLNEIKRALRAGIPSYKIIFSGVGKTEDEIRQALNLDILFINIESSAELEMIEKISKDLKKIARISVRVNPNIDAKTHPYISTGLSDNKFGIDLEEAKRIYLYINKSEFLKAVGIHFHIGSQILDATPMLQACEIVQDLARSIKAINKDLRFFDIGGGFGINYLESERIFNIENYLKTISSKIVALDLSIVCEPGRFIVGNSGYLLTKVIREKQSKTKRFVIVDAAMNDLIRPSLYNADHEIIKLDSSKDKKSLCDVVGPICESGDYLAKDIYLSECCEGDLLLIKSAGAYAYSMSSNYNSRMRPAEIALKKEGDKLKDFIIKDREDFDKSIENELKFINNI